MSMSIQPVGYPKPISYPSEDRDVTTTQAATLEQQAVELEQEKEEFLKEADRALTKTEMPQQERISLIRLLAEAVDSYLKHSHEESEEKKDKIRQLKEKIKQGNYDLSNLTAGKGYWQWGKLVATVLLMGLATQNSDLLKSKGMSMESLMTAGTQMIGSVVEALTLTKYESSLTAKGGQTKLDQSEFDQKSQQQGSDSSNKQQVTQMIDAFARDMQTWMKNQ